MSDGDRFLWMVDWWYFLVFQSKMANYSSENANDLLNPDVILPTILGGDYDLFAPSPNVNLLFENCSE